MSENSKQQRNIANYMDLVFLMGMVSILIGSCILGYILCYPEDLVGNGKTYLMCVAVCGGFGILGLSISYVYWAAASIEYGYKKFLDFLQETTRKAQMMSTFIAAVTFVVYVVISYLTLHDSYMRFDHYWRAIVSAVGVKFLVLFLYKIFGGKM